MVLDRIYCDTMTWLDRALLFSTLDYSAVVCILAASVLIGWHIEHPPRKRPSVSLLMSGFRREWMHEMVTRQPRIFDATLIGNMRQGAAFFASGTMVAIGGSLALIGNSEQIAGVAQDFALESAPDFVWEIKLVIMLLFATSAFLKFVWSHRLFGYCAVLMAATPNDVDQSRAYVRASQAAEISITAARSFNRGLRATYFGLASAAWLFGAYALIGATLFTVAVLWRREFASQSRSVLLGNSPRMTHDR